MSKKLIRYIILIAVIGLLGYNSVYFKKLDAKEIITTANASPVEVAQQFWAKQLPAYMDSAIEINVFLQMLKANPQQVVEKYSHTQGIGNITFFLVKGEGIIEAVNEDEVMVTVRTIAGEIKLQLVTGVYFGNAVRDVTGKISMGDFANTMDFNTVSTELNKQLRTAVIIPFKTTAKKGNAIAFTGCIEMNKEKIDTTAIALLPLKIINQ